jgi:hypothetical protein
MPLPPCPLPPAERPRGRIRNRTVGGLALASGEPRGQEARRGVLRRNAAAAAGPWRCRPGAGGRQVSRRPRRVRAWRPHGRPRAPRSCSLLPHAAALPCLACSRCPRLGVAPSPLSLASLAFSSQEGRERELLFFFLRFFEFLPHLYIYSWLGGCTCKTRDFWYVVFSLLKKTQRL